VSVVCPAGHESSTADYCDQCGAPIAQASPPPTEALPAVEEVDTSATAPAQPCPACGAFRSGDDRYCEECGHDFLAAPVSQPSDWEAIAAADRARFERCAAAGLEFPEGYEERRFALDGTAMRIGRSRGRADESLPEIDLSGRQEDPGVSRVHAVLERQDDGRYAVRDLGSTNGTTVNDDPRPIDAGAAVVLADGDRVRVGAWTTITLRTTSKVVRREHA
jgi:hypothetical protein